MKKLEKVKAYVAEATDGTLYGPFRTAQQACEWLRWDDSKKPDGSRGSGPDLNGKIRLVLSSEA